MCCNPIILQQWYDIAGKFHSYYFADFNPDIHTPEFINNITKTCHRVGMFRHKFVTVPCGKCVQCRARNARDWKVRLYHHSLTYGDAVFVTLTYDDDHMDSVDLNYHHFQLFMKRLRRKFPDKRITYFVSGEYGSSSLRRHFHCIIFGLDFDLIKSRFLCRSRRAKDVKIWTSDVLSDCWDFRGYVSCSKVYSGDFRVFGYVSGYIISKSSEKHLFDVSSCRSVPEFHHMSLKPAIGLDYFLSNVEQIYRNDYVLINSRKVSVPRAYDYWFKKFTSRYVISDGVTGFGFIKILNSFKTNVERMSFIFQICDKFSLVIDKVSDFDIIKSRRIDRFLKSSAFTCSQYNLDSVKYNLSKIMYYNRDLDIGGVYV